jgi:hypothetical protein
VTDVTATAAKSRNGFLSMCSAMHPQGLSSVQAAETDRRCTLHHDMIQLFFRDDIPFRVVLDAIAVPVASMNFT